MEEFFYNENEVSFFNKTYLLLFIIGLMFLIIFVFLGIKEGIKDYKNKNEIRIEYKTRKT